MEGTNASVIDPATWCSFGDAVAFATNEPERFNGIGFVFTDSDPYAGIDIDGHGGDQYRQLVGQRIIAAFESYTEISPSGNGLHIIVRGCISGSRRAGIEAYSSGRFFTFTGNVFRALPIADYGPLLLELQKDLKPTRRVLTLLNEQAQTESDEAIIQRMLGAKNNDKIRRLINGDGSAIGSGSDQSGSAIDLAIVNSIQFYSKNVEQIERIWRSTPHAESRSKKMKRRDYVMSTIGLAFDREFPPIDLSEIQKMPVWGSNTIQAEVREETSYPIIVTTPDAVVSSAPVPIVNDGHGLMPHVPTTSPYTLPPGLLGDLARHMHATSPRPVQEISLASAIALMAGVCGKAWNIGGSGLNQYILVLAKTGRGKDAIETGINSIVEHCVSDGNLAARNFVGPSNINSGQAIAKYLGDPSNRSFISIIGEVGGLLARLGSKFANSADMRLTSELLGYYGKSGQGSVIGKNIYSDRAESVGVVRAPGVSLIGEGNHTSIYNAIDDNMIKTGLLPRFLIINYEGIRVPLNKQRGVLPSKQLITRMGDLMTCAATNINKELVTEVRYDNEASFMDDRYEKLCTYYINESSGTRAEIVSELWNRAHMKTIRLAALVAVGCNMYAPVITGPIWQWAEHMVTHDVRLLIDKFDNGEINGSVATQQWNALRQACINYSKLDEKQLARMRSTKDMQHKGLIPYSYLMQSLANVNCFKDGNVPFKQTYKNVIEMAQSSGMLAPTFGQSASAVWYQVVDPRLLHDFRSV